MNISSPPSSQRAFSLVEVALALGIISVALTSLLALMPVGLTMFRESLETTVQADILRQLSAEFQKTPFGEINTRTEMRNFSDEGTEITDEGFFGVTYAVENATPLLNGSSYDNANLKTVHVSFFTRQDRAHNPMKPSSETILFVPDHGR